MSNDITESTHAINIALENTPQAYQFLEPKLEKEDREDAKAVMKKYSSVMAEFSMTNMFQAMKEDPNNAGLNWMKTMAPYMFEKQATTIRAETTGAIDDETADGLKEFLKERGNEV